MRNIPVAPVPAMSWLVPGTLVVLDQAQQGFTIRPAKDTDTDPYLFVSDFYPVSAVYTMDVNPDAKYPTEFVPHVMQLIADCPVEVRKIVYQHPPRSSDFYVR